MVGFTGPVIFIIGRFLILIQSPYFLLIYLVFLFLHDSVLVVCTFPGIYPFLLCCLIFGHMVAHSSLLWSLYGVFCNVVSVVMSPLLFILLLIWVPLFSLVSLPKLLSILSLERNNLGFVNIFLLFSCSLFLLFLL